MATPVTRVLLADGTPFGHTEGFHDPRWLKANDIFGVDGLRLAWQAKLPAGLVFESLPPGGKAAKELRAKTKEAYAARESRERAVLNATTNAATEAVRAALVAAGFEVEKVGQYGHGSMGFKLNGITVSLGLTAHYREEQ